MVSESIVSVSSMREHCVVVAQSSVVYESAYTTTASEENMQFRPVLQVGQFECVKVACTDKNCLVLTKEGIVLLLRRKKVTKDRQRGNELSSGLSNGDLSNMDLTESFDTWRRRMLETMNAPSMIETSEEEWHLSMEAPDNESLFQGEAEIIDIGEPVISIASGANHSILLSQSGEVFYLSCQEDMNDLVIDYTIMNVVEEWDILDRNTSDGKGGSLESLNRPAVSIKKMKMPSKIAQVACGGGFTLCLDIDGYAYGFGLNIVGQLGLGDTCDRFFPAAPTFHDMTKDKIKQMACGKDFTIFLTQQGHLYGMGNTQHGQLGIDPCDVLYACQTIGRNGYATNPIRLLQNITQDYDIIRIVCGDSFTCIVTQCGKCFWFGRIGREKESYHAELLNTVNDNQSDIYVKRVFCGFGHVIINGEDRKDNSMEIVGLQSGTLEELQVAVSRARFQHFGELPVSNNRANKQLEILNVLIEASPENTPRTINTDSSIHERVISANFETPPCRQSSQELQSNDNQCEVIIMNGDLDASDNSSSSESYVENEDSISTTVYYDFREEPTSASRDHISIVKLFYDSIENVMETFYQQAHLRLNGLDDRITSSSNNLRSVRTGLSSSIERHHMLEASIIKTVQSRQFRTVQEKRQGISDPCTLLQRTIDEYNALRHGILRIMAHMAHQSDTTCNMSDLVSDFDINQFVDRMKRFIDYSYKRNFSRDMKETKKGNDNETELKKCYDELEAPPARNSESDHFVALPIQLSDTRNEERAVSPVLSELSDIASPNHQYRSEFTGDGEQKNLINTAKRLCHVVSHDIGRESYDSKHGGHDLVTMLQAQIHELKKTVSELSTENELLLDSNIDLEEMIESYRGSADEAAKERDGIATEMNNCREWNMELEDKLTQTQMLLYNVEKEWKGILQESKRSSETRIQFSKEQIAKLESLLASERECHKKVLHERLSSEERVSQLSQEYKNAKQQMQELSNELAQSQKQLTDMNNTNRETQREKDNLSHDICGWLEHVQSLHGDFKKDCDSLQNLFMARCDNGKFSVKLDETRGALKRLLSTCANMCDDANNASNNLKRELSNVTKQYVSHVRALSQILESMTDEYELACKETLVLRADIETVREECQNHMTEHQQTKSDVNALCTRLSAMSDKCNDVIQVNQKQQMIIRQQHDDLHASKTVSEGTMARCEEEQRKYKALQPVLKEYEHCIHSLMAHVKIYDNFTKSITKRLERIESSESSLSEQDTKEQLQCFVQVPDLSQQMFTSNRTGSHYQSMSRPSTERITSTTETEHPMDEINDILFSSKATAATIEIETANRIAWISKLMSSYSTEDIFHMLSRMSAMFDRVMRQKNVTIETYSKNLRKMRGELVRCSQFINAYVSDMSHSDCEDKEMSLISAGMADPAEFSNE